MASFLAGSPGFRAGRGGVSLVLGDGDALLLRELLEQLLALLGEEEAEPDPLAAAVGIGTATELPADPALARLLPDAYPDDPEQAAEFRRYTEQGLREAKRSAARTALATLAEMEGRERSGWSGRHRPDALSRVRLTGEQAQAWLGALNDLRLSLGTRLGVSEEWDAQADALPEGDPGRYGFAIYDYLTWLQESLVQALMRGL